MFKARIIDDADVQMLVFPKEIRIEQSELAIRKIGDCLLLFPVSPNQGVCNLELEKLYRASRSTLAMMNATFENANRGANAEPINSKTAEAPSNGRLEGTIGLEKCLKYLRKKALQGTLMLDE